MGQRTVQYAAGTSPRKKRVYYAGTATLKEGYALFYDDTATVDASDSKLAMGTLVEQCTAENIAMFAGVVTGAVGGNGKAGPCFVEIWVPTPGEFVKFWASEDFSGITVGASAYLTGVAGQWHLDDADAPAQATDDFEQDELYVGQCVEAVDASSTEQALLMRFV